MLFATVVKLFVVSLIVSVVFDANSMFAVVVVSLSLLVSASASAAAAAATDVDTGTGAVDSVIDLALAEKHFLLLRGGLNRT